MVIKLAESAAPPSFRSTGKTGSEIANVQPEKKKGTTWHKEGKNHNLNCAKKRHNFGVAHKRSLQNLLRPGRIIATDASSAESRHSNTDFEHFLLCGFIVETTFGSAE
jgi:hypothetical protein